MKKIAAKSRISYKAKSIGYLFIAIVIVFGCTQHTDPGQQIVFAAKAFFDSAKHTGEGSVYVAGTLSGDGVYYKNNTVAITCYKDRMECLSYSVAQIGTSQVSRLEAPTSYPVTNWDAHEIVAAGFADSMNCRKVTITINRKSEITVWAEEPTNQSTASCKDVDTRIRKWTIDDSPGWKALHANNK